MRADPKCYRLLDRDVGEVIVRGREGKPTLATVSLYNRGDDGEISFQTYTTRFTEWKTALDAKMGVRAQSRGIIYYTDSWGEGHERKSMRADEAYCMTMALYTMVPNR